MFRKKVIIGLIVFFILIAAIFYCFTDTWLENKVEENATEWNGALVEVDNLHFSLIDLQLSWDRLQITNSSNTMKNSLETGRCLFDLELTPLISGKVIVENFVVKDVRQGTDRETDGKVELPEKPAGEPGFIESTMNALDSEIADTPIMNLDKLKDKVNVDNVLSMLEIKSPDKIDSLKNAISEKYSAWEKRFSEIDNEGDYKEIKKKINSINVKRIKNVQQIAAAVTTVNDVKKKVDELKKSYESVKSDLSADLKETAGVKELAAGWIKSDYKSALSEAKLPEFTAENIGKILFGKRIVSNLNQYLGYINTVREYYSGTESGDEEKVDDPPRLEGQDVYFYEENADPDFWLKNLDLSGVVGSNLNIAGTITDIVSDQRLIGKPTVFDISGGDDREQLSIEGALSYFSVVPSEKFIVSYLGMDLSGVKLSDSKLLPNTFSKGTGDLHAELNLEGESIEGVINFNAKNIAYNLEKENVKAADLEKMVRKLISKVVEVDFTARIYGTQNEMKFSIKSNLDKLFTDNLKSMLGEEVDKLKTKINEKIDSVTAKYKNQLYGIVDKQQSKLNESLKKFGLQSVDLDNLLNSKTGELDKKKKELEGSLKKKLLDKIF